ncbi:MAG: DUF1015 domain-containing protein [Candidatus Aenigmarchaeota archaeon]|nr:DUF1015 domain-containing protein [Candidatus Aenigmarchaeota archaeon]
MVNILPFRGYRYDKERVDIGKVVSPPYDVINPKFQEELYRRSDYNIVRIILGKDEGEDNESENKYTRAYGFFESWIEGGYLKPDGKPCIYVYSQEFEVSGEKKERTGFVAVVELEEFGKNILPHEFTLKGPKIGRRLLLEKTKANFGQIFSIYLDQEKRIDSILGKEKKKPPEFDVTDEEGIRHRFWVINDEEMIKGVAEEMRDKKVFIADGHHRYETSLEYSKDHPENGKAKYTMMTLVNMKNEGLVILPTHRLVNELEPFDREQLIDRLKQNFDIETIEFEETNEKGRKGEMFKKMKSEKHSFGMYLGDNRYFVFTLKDEGVMDKKVKDCSNPWKRLDVSVLHTLVLEDLLGIDTTKPEKQHHVEYVKDTKDAVDECVAKVKNGESQIALFMNPTRIEEVEEVAENGDKMPQKSTFFYPKVYTGFVIYKF